MIQYEYKVVETNLDPGGDDFIYLLNELGKEKWELVTMERFVTDPDRDIRWIWLLFLIRRKNV